MQVRHSKALSPFKEHDKNFLTFNQKSSLSDRTWTHYGSQVHSFDPALFKLTSQYFDWYRYDFSIKALA